MAKENSSGLLLRRRRKNHMIRALNLNDDIINKVHLTIRVIFSFLALPLLTSCFTISSEFKTGEGKKAFSINCRYAFPPKMDKCYERAKELCPDGFLIFPYHSSEGYLTTERKMTAVCSNRTEGDDTTRSN